MTPDVSGATVEAEAIGHPRPDSPQPLTGAAGWYSSLAAGWHPIRLGFTLVRNDSGVWGEDGDETDTPVIRSTEVAVDGSWAIGDPARRKLSASELAMARLAEGDLVVTTSSGSQLHLGKTALVNREVAERGYAFSNFMQRLRAAQHAEPRYLFYFLNSSVGREQLNYFGSTTTGLRNLSGRVLSRVVLPGAPRDEQRVIADFLDCETEKIDALLAKKQQLIELLREQRTALISHAVTKGIDPDAPMKDSGIEHPHTIPRDWHVARIKHILRAPLAYGVLKPDKYEGDDAVPILRILDISRSPIDIQQLEAISPTLSLEYRRTVVAPDDLIVSVVGTIGKAAIVSEQMVGMNLSRALARLQLRKDVYCRFIWYFVASRMFQDRAVAVPTGTAQRVLNLSDLNEFPLVLPTEPEQTRVVRYLDSMTESIDRLEASVETAIARLAEYRSALIAAAVTGQIDVRDYAKEAS